MLERYKELLNSARSAELGALTVWYSLFRMREDPFSAQVSSEEIEYFVDRKDLVDSIVFDIGAASRGIPVVILVVGPFGSGKTAILQYIHSALKKLQEKYPDEYSVAGESLSAHSLFEKPEESEDEAEEVQLWVRNSKTDRNYLFVDDATPAYIKSVIQHFVRTRLKVFAISPLDYDEVYSILRVAPKTHFLHAFDIKAVEDMMDRRIKRALVNETELSVYDLFSEDALYIIHKYGMGVPYLILKCASTSLTLLRDTYAHKTTPDFAESKKVDSEIATRACKINKCFQAFTRFGEVSQTKLLVLKQVIKGGKTPTEISSILGKNRTTVSRHLSDLREEGLVEFTTRGRESVYEACEPVKIRFEIENMPKGEWELASA